MPDTRAFRPYVDTDTAFRISDVRTHIFQLVKRVIKYDGAHIRVISNQGVAVLVSERAWHSLRESVEVFTDPVNGPAVAKSIVDYMNGEPGTAVDPWSRDPEIYNWMSILD